MTNEKKPNFAIEFLAGFEMGRKDIADIECKLMKAEYDLAEMEKFTDDLIKQKVTDERNRIIKEIEEYINKANTDLYGVDWVLTKDLLKQLTSLKQ